MTIVDPLSPQLKLSTSVHRGGKQHKCHLFGIMVNVISEPVVLLYYSRISEHLGETFKPLQTFYLELLVSGQGVLAFFPLGNVCFSLIANYTPTVPET